MGDRSITIKKVSSATKSSNGQLVNEKWYELENKGIIRGIRKAGRSPFYKWMRLLFLGFIYNVGVDSHFLSFSILKGL